LAALIEFDQGPAHWVTMRCETKQMFFNPTLHVHSVAAENPSRIATSILLMDGFGSIFRR